MEQGSNTPTEGEDPAQSTERRAVFVAATLGAFVTPFMLSSLNVALPAIGRDFSLSAVQLGWISTIFLLASGALMVPIGKVADTYGRKRVYLIGIVVMTVTSLAAALTPSYEWLLAFRALQGVGGAMVFSTMVAILSVVYPPGDRGRVIGVNVAAVYVGLSVGPAVGGLLTEAFGWRSVFVVPGSLGIVVALVVLIWVKGEWAERTPGRFDYAGSLIYAAGLVALMLGFSFLPQTAGVMLAAFGVFLLAAFVYWETRVPQPVLNVGLFRRNRVFAFSNLAALISYSATFAVAFLLSLYLQYVRDLSAEQAGLVLLFQPAMQAAVSPWAGRLSDRVEGRVVASAGMGLTVVGLALLSFLGAGTPILYVVLTLCLLGIGFGLFSSPNTNTVMGSVERRYFGVASATLSTMRLMGQVFSMGLAMLAFALLLGGVQAEASDPADLMTAVRVVFAVFTGLCVLGVLASLSRGTLGERRAADA
jgi:EmrB/QacA subfamily drug resistance transporter